MDGVRVSALALHGLAASDRKWLMARLPAAQRERLRGLLQDLRGAGVQADAELVQRIVREKAAHDAAPDATQAQARLMRVEAAQIWTLVRGEPDLMVARLLRLHAWPWAAEVLIAAGKARAQRLESLMERLEPAPGLDAALLAEVEARIASSRMGEDGQARVRWPWRRKGDA